LRMSLSGRLNARGPADLSWREDMVLLQIARINMRASAYEIERECRTSS
jgi:hypothetical protein